MQKAPFPEPLSFSWLGLSDAPPLTPPGAWLPLEDAAPLVISESWLGLEGKPYLLQIGFLEKIEICNMKALQRLAS